MSAYYNEIDPEAVAVLRELIASGVIAPGDVDGRSIKEVSADDIRGYTQCHFFAGAGLWSVAAGLAGWADERPLWTASCPCQPWSGAGKQVGDDDPRHLWPDLYRLIRAARASGQRIPVLVGEQVAGSLGYGWFDGVRTDLAREEIAARTIDIPACAVDAPHERNRLWWCAVADAQEQRRWTGLREAGAQRYGAEPANGDGRDIVLAHGDGSRRLQREGSFAAEWGWPDHGNAEGALHVAGAAAEGRHVQDRSIASSDGRNGSWWADAEWLACHDGKARRAKPGIPMLVDGMAGRASVWRLAGNSIVSQLAAEVLAAILEAEEMMPPLQLGEMAGEGERT